MVATRHPFALPRAAGNRLDFVKSRALIGASQPSQKENLFNARLRRIYCLYMKCPSNSWLILAVGFIGAVLVALSVMLTWGGHGVYTPLIIVTSPLGFLGWGKAVIVAPFLLMGEGVLALCRRWCCLGLFCVCVLGGYVYAFISISIACARPGVGSDDLARFIEWWVGGYFWVITPAAIIYIGMQALLWRMLMSTWSEGPQKRVGGP